MWTRLLWNIKLSQLQRNANIKSPMTTKCIIETYMISLGGVVSTFGMNNKPLLPLMEKKLTKATYNEVVANHLPVMIYNMLYVSSFPLNKELIGHLERLEELLVLQKDNHWVKLLETSFYTRTAITKHTLLSMDTTQAAVMELARPKFDAACKTQLNKIEKTLIQEPLKNTVLLWLNAKRDEVHE